MQTKHHRFLWNRAIPKLNLYSNYIDFLRSSADISDTSVNKQLDEQLKYLAAQACETLPGSQERQEILTEIIRLAKNRLWKETTSYYQEALQQTWLYLCRNICSNTTGKAYDPNKGSVISWLNTYLKYRLQDFYLQQRWEQAITVVLEVPECDEDSSEIIEPLDTLPATPQAPLILENLQIWVQTDSDGELRSTHIKGYPQVNCQVLILKRLPPEVSWKELSEEFGLPIATLSSFYQRQCLPRLRKFAQLEGWL